MSRTTESAAKGIGEWVKRFAFLACVTTGGCSIGDPPINSLVITVQSSNDLATSDDIGWVVATILQAEQFHCDPNPEVMIFDSHWCPNANSELTLVYRIEGRLVEITLHGGGLLRRVETDHDLYGKLNQLSSASLLRDFVFWIP